MRTDNPTGMTIPPATSNPTDAPTDEPNVSPVTSSPTSAPTDGPTDSPVTLNPTGAPTDKPAMDPVTSSPTGAPTDKPIGTSAPTTGPITKSPVGPTTQPSRSPTANCDLDNGTPTVGPALTYNNTVPIPQCGGDCNQNDDNCDVSDPLSSVTGYSSRFYFFARTLFLTRRLP